MWRFDEASGNAVDSSGSGNTGTPTGATIVSNCKRGGCRSFNGSTDFISVVDSAFVDLPQNHTVSVWVKLNSGTGDQAIVFKGRCNEKYASYSLKIGVCDGSGSANKINYTIRTSNAAGGVTVTQTGSPNTGVWTHIVGVQDGTTLMLYINGVLDNTSVGNSSAPYNVSTILQFGSDWDCAAARRFQFSGQMDDVRIYNRALTAQEVHDLYVPGVVLGGFVINGAKINQ